MKVIIASRGAPYFAITARIEEKADANDMSAAYLSLDLLKKAEDTNPKLSPTTMPVIASKR